ncbi:CsbD family protein [Agrobacterium sp. 16-172Ci]
MGSTSDKISGKANEVAGKVKKSVGEATGNNELRAKGAAQETKGKVQTSVGKAKDAVKGAVDRM